MQIGTAHAAPGSKAHGLLEIGEMAFCGSVALPVSIVQGAQPGPVLWLNGTVHGEELNAFMAMRNCVRDLNPAQLRGTLVCTPLANPVGAAFRSLRNPLDLLDIDQQFPGAEQGVLAQRIAARLGTAVRAHATHLVSFHTVGPQYRANPYTIFKTEDGFSPALNRQITDMTLAFGVQDNCHVHLSSATGEVPGGAGNALDAMCCRAGIPAFMAEIGEGGVFDPACIAVAEQGIYRLMTHLGMYESTVPQPPRPRLIRRRRFIYADQAGFFVDQGAPGELLQAGQSMGRIIDFTAQKGEIFAPEPALLMLTRRHPLINTGDRVALLGFDWEDL